MEDSSSQCYTYSSQCNKCKNRPPTPLPSSTYSNTDTDNAESEMSFNIYSQDEGNLSTDRTTPEMFYIPMTSHNACQSMLPRPSCIPVLKTQNTTKNQHKDKPTTQKITTSPRPSCIPVFNDNRHKLTLQVTQPAVQPTICSLPRPSEETILKQPMQICPEPTKSPLLPTPPAHNRQSTSPRSSASNCSRNSTFSRPLPTFSRPSLRNNYRFHQQTYIPRPHTPEFNNQRPPLLPRPPYQHQDFIPRPYQQHQQPQGHCTQQVFHVHITLPYPPQYCAA